MKLRVKVFASLKDYFPKDLEIEMNSNSTLQDLFDRLENINPKSKAILDICLAAVNEEFIEKKFIFSENLEVCLLPPASGG